MSSELSPYAIHRIVYYIENDDRRSRKVKKTSVAPTQQHLRRVNGRWNFVYTLYILNNRPPPMGYLRSLELALFLKYDLDNKAMRNVFGHGKPLVFDADLPQLLVPAIVEAFRQLKEEPSFLDDTISNSAGTRATEMDLTALWPQAYIDYVPSAAWTTADGHGRANKGKPQEVKRSQDNSGTHVAPSLVVEEFHIASKHFGKQLTVELHFTLGNRLRQAAIDRPSTAPDLVKNELRNVAIRLENLPCGGLPSGMARRRKSLLLVADFAVEVYGFLDRTHVGASLLANSALNDLIFKLGSRLPVNHLSCEFKPIFEWKADEDDLEFTGTFKMVLCHFRRDLPYIDVRRFKVPLEAGPAADCALILRYLSNSHFFNFEEPVPSSRFTVQMLAALADRNFSVETVQMWHNAVLHYRSMDAAFGGGLRLGTLYLMMFEHKFADLVKTTDFFRLPTVRRLKALCLELENPSHTSEVPRRWNIVPPSLWIAGIQLLHSSERFEVQYESKRFLRPIFLKLVQLCEKFERGEISKLVQHFKFSTSRFMARYRYATWPDGNKTDSDVKVGDNEWDVYRFRNAVTGEWLTACVGHETCEYTDFSVVHIVKGEVYPDASFAAE